MSMNDQSDASTGMGHTPGPWVLRGSDNATPHILHQQHDCPEQDISDPDQLVCILPAEITRSYNSWANARLIASAPELLEACMAMVAWDEAEKMAKPYDDDNGADWRQRLALCAEAFDKARAAIAKATQA
jgi:hypothetical protein